MSDQAWVTVAQSLPEGSTRKIGHDCGPGDCLQINHKRDGWSAYCHRCTYKGFVPRPAETLSEKLARLQRIQAAERDASLSPSLPMPAEYEPSLWPLAARVWLYTAGLSNVEIRQLGYYWNARIQRVVMPIRDAEGNLLYWQARTLDKTNPRKYLNQRGVDKHSFVAKYGTGPLVVLTEDILSGYRVSRAGVEAWPLMGTKLSTKLAAEIIQDGRPVACWLDSDSAGRTAAARVCKTLRSYGIKVTNLVSDADPKLLSREEITWKLSKHCALPA